MSKTKDEPGSWLIAYGRAQDGLRLVTLRRDGDTHQTNMTPAQARQLARVLNDAADELDRRTETCHD